MTCAELIKINRNWMELMSKFDLKASDYKFIDLYEKFQKLKADGEKYWYIITHLSEEYNISESSVKRLIRKLSREVSLGTLD